MRTRLRILAIAFALAFVEQVGAVPELADVAGHYSIAPTSKIGFTVAQVGGGGITGAFQTFSGAFDLNPANVRASHVSFTLRPSSVTAPQPRITNFLKSTAVFDAAQYPVITFRSTRVTPIDGESARIDGVLSAKGHSRNESFTATLLDHRGRTVAFHVVGHILRSPYDMDVGTPIYSNVVRFDMVLRGNRS